MATPTFPTLPALPWYRSLRFKLVLAATIVEVVMLGILLSNSYHLLGTALEAQTQIRLKTLRPLLNATLASRVFQRDHSEIEAVLRPLVDKESAAIAYILVETLGGDLIAHAGELDPKTILDVEMDQSALGCMADFRFDTQIPLVLADDIAVGRVRFGLSLASLIDLRDKVMQQSLIIAAVEVLISFLLLVSLGYLLTRHLAELLAATRRVASADFSTPIQIDSRDEIGQLAEDFNRMQDEVQQRITALAESESRFRTIFDAAGDAFFIHDAETGRLLDVNRRMCEMYGCTYDEALNLPPETFCSNQPHSHLTDAYEKLALARTEGPQTFDWQARRADDGTLFWVEVNLRYVMIGDAERILALVRDISERKRYQQKLEFLAHHDPLTQLPNRILLADRLSQAIAQTQRNQRLLGVLMLDLDGFKPVNDTLGHEVGDRLLMLLAQRLRDSVRAGDTVSRVGGDEFALLLCELSTIEEGNHTFQRLVDAVATPCEIDNHTIHVSASIGITVYPFDDADADTLLRHADQAMYVAKQTGRNRYHLFDAEQDRLAQAHHTVKSRIIAALERHEFLMHYQPQIDMRSGRVIGAEALIRWQHPEEGLLPPVRFLPVIEDSETAIPLGEWVIDAVLQQMNDWQAAGLTLKIGINISARHLQAPNFFERLSAALARYPALKAEYLALEIVESVALADMAKVADIIDACHALGISFALDDFGTGYSSLSYFKRLKIDQVKIDKSFVQNLLKDEEDHAIVSGVIAMSQSFKRGVIAEGVESLEIGLRLNEMGCHLLQGYGIAKPMPAAALADWISAWHQQPRW